MEKVKKEIKRTRSSKKRYIAPTMEKHAPLNIVAGTGGSGIYYYTYYYY